MTEPDPVQAALIDGDWSLPDWPDTGSTLTSAAHRRRLISIGGSLTIVTIVAASIVGSVTNVTTFRAHARVTHNAVRQLFRPIPFKLAPLPQMGADGFSTNVYPASGKQAKSATIACPSTLGLDPQRPPLQLAVYDKLGHIDPDGGLNEEFARADRSLWPAIDREYSNLADVHGHVPIQSWTPVSIKPAVESPSAFYATKECGPKLVADSDALIIKQGKSRDQVFVLSRGGVPLTWEVNAIFGDGGAEPGPYLFHSGSERPDCGFPLRVAPMGPSEARITETHDSGSFTQADQSENQPCRVVAQPTLYLIAAPGTGAYPTPIGKAHNFLLSQGGSASLTLRLTSCHGPVRRYTELVDENTHAVTPINLIGAACGLTQTSFSRNP